MSGLLRYKQEEKTMPKAHLTVKLQPHPIPTNAGDLHNIQQQFFCINYFICRKFFKLFFQLFECKCNIIQIFSSIPFLFLPYNRNIVRASFNRVKEV